MTFLDFRLIDFFTLRQILGEYLYREGDYFSNYDSIYNTTQYNIKIGLPFYHSRLKRLYMSCLL